jgi:arylsulfatase A-like enzyme
MKNLVFLLCDQLRADIAYHEKYPFVQAPHLDQLRAEGVTFRNTFCAFPVCGPSRASLMTGRYPTQHGVLNNRSMLPPEERTLGHHLADLGYDTIALGKTHGQNPGFRRMAEPPLEKTLGIREWAYFKGLSNYETKVTGGNLQPLLDTFNAGKENHYDFILTRQFGDFLERRKPERPFAAFVGFHTPHPPLVIPKEFVELYPAEAITLPQVDDLELQTKPAIQKVSQGWRMASPETRRRMIAAYLALTTYLDECVGRVVELLQTRGLLEETLLVFTSDHGDQLGEHNLLGKFNMFYEGSLRAPLIVRLPSGDYAGFESQHLVEHIDLYPSICDWLDVPQPTQLAGKTLNPIFTNPGYPHREYVHCSLVETRAHQVDAPGSGEHSVQGEMIRSQRWKLACYDRACGELYDLQNDPDERRNLYGDPAFSEIKLMLLEEMLKHTLHFRRDPTLWGYNDFPG